MRGCLCRSCFLRAGNRRSYYGDDIKRQNYKSGRADSRSRASAATRYMTSTEVDESESHLFSMTAAQDGVTLESVSYLLLSC